LGGDAVATAVVVRWDERKFKIKKCETEKDGRRKVRGDVTTGPGWWRQWIRMDTGD